MKPHISLCKEEILSKSKKPWQCCVGDVCARGATPKDAYDTVINYFYGPKTPTRDKVWGGVCSNQHK